MTLMVGGKLLKIRLSSHPVVAVMIEACGIQSPQYEQKIRGTQVWFYQSSGTTGEDDAGSTVATQWPTNMQYEVAFLDLN